MTTDFTSLCRGPHHTLWELRWKQTNKQINSKHTLSQKAFELSFDFCIVFLNIFRNDSFQNFDYSQIKYRYETSAFSFQLLFVFLFRQQTENAFFFFPFTLPRLFYSPLTSRNQYTLAVSYQQTYSPDSIRFISWIVFLNSWSWTGVAGRLDLYIFWPRGLKHVTKLALMFAGLWIVHLMSRLSPLSATWTVLSRNNTVRSRNTKSRVDLVT